MEGSGHPKAGVVREAVAVELAEGDDLLGESDEQEQQDESAEEPPAVSPGAEGEAEAQVEIKNGEQQVVPHADRGQSSAAGAAQGGVESQCDDKAVAQTESGRRTGCGDEGAEGGKEGQQADEGEKIEELGALHPCGGQRAGHEEGAEQCAEQQEARRAQETGGQVAEHTGYESIPIGIGFFTIRMTRPLFRKKRINDRFEEIKGHICIFRTMTNLDNV